jgi:hypothetical protein
MNQDRKQPDGGGSNRGSRPRFSIKSIMVVTAVFAASGASLGHLWRAAHGDQSEIGQFVIVTAMLPMVVLVAASWFFKIFGRFIK